MKRFILFTLLFYSLLSAQTAHFIQDLNTSTNSAYPINLTDVNGDLFFITNDRNTEYLWQLDGTTKEIDMLYQFDNHGIFFYEVSYKDQYIFSLFDNSLGGQLWKAAKNGNVSKFADIEVDRMTVFNDNIYIISGNKLYKSDAVSTELLYTFADDPLFMVASSSYLYIVMAYGPPAELWKTDGSSENTTKVSDFNNRSIYWDIAAHNDLIYFYTDSSNTTQLWRSDGSAQGTSALQSFKKFSYGKRYIQSAGRQVYFTPYTDDQGRELWVTDGTAENTRMVMDIYEGNNSSVPDFLTDVQGTLFFIGNENQLWKSNGTEESTLMVKQLPNDYNHPVKALFSHDGNVYFDGYSQEDGRELWVSDGTTAGTKLLKDIEPGDYSSDPSGFCSSADALYFSAFSTQYGTELWSSNGTAEATQIVLDIETKTNDSYPRGYTTFDNSVYFYAADQDGQNIFRTDISTLQTEKVISGRDNYVKEFKLRTAGDHIFFIGGEDFSDRALWQINGISAEASFVKSANIRAMTIFRDTLYFTLNDSNGVAEIWKSDGSTEGTTRITQVYPDDNQYIDYLRVAGDLLYFTYYNEDAIWRTDGTAAGTFALPIDDRPEFQFGVTEMAGKFFFRGNRSLWVSNGSIEGTIKLFDEDSGYYLMSIQPFKGTLYFLVQNKSNLYTSLYQSDGTLPGTQPVMTFNDVLAGGLFASSADLFVTASGSLGNELYKVLLGAQDIQLMKDINPGSAYAYIADVLAVNNLLFFSAVSPDHGGEVWYCDGTPAGTKVIDIVPGSEHSNPHDFYFSNGTLFLSAIQPGLGQELWAIEDIPVSLRDNIFQPGKMTLSQNYPNPFNNSTIINYQLSLPADVKLLLYDVLGREVMTLVDKKQAAGSYRLNFDASALSSGIYYYRLTAGPSASSGRHVQQSRKMLLLR